MKPVYLTFLLLLAPLLHGCGGDDSPSDPFNVGIERTVTLLPFERSVPGGGDVNSLTLGPGDEIIAVIDNRLVRIPQGGELDVIDDAESWIWGRGTPSGGVVGLTSSEIVSWPAGSSTPVITSIEATGTGASIVHVRGDFSPDGTNGIIAVVSSEPRTRAWYTTDGGKTWERLQFSDGSESLRLRADLVFLPDGSLLAGNADGLYAAVAPGGAWSERTRNMPNRATALLVASNGDIYRYSPGAGGFAVSTDGGQSFLDLWFNALPPFFIDVELLSGGDLLALANSTTVGGAAPLSRPMGIYRSTDGGRSWIEEMQLSATSLDVRGSSAAIGMTVGPVSGQEKPGGILLSVDRGEVWREIGSGIGGSGENVDAIGFVGDGELVMLSRGGIYRNASLRLRLVSAPFGLQWIAGDAEGGIWWTTDHGTFRRDAAGVIEEIEGAETGAEPIRLREGGLLLVGTDRIHRFDFGSGLTTIADDPPVLTNVVQISGNSLAGISADGTTLRSIDGGRTWAPTEDPEIAACNSLGGCIVQRDGRYFLLPSDTASAAPLRFVGLPGALEEISVIRYDSRDLLWVLMKNGRLLSSNAEVR